MIKIENHSAVGISSVRRSTAQPQWALARWENEGGSVQGVLPSVAEIKVEPSLKGQGNQRVVLA
jgi:hypothetical protein